MIDTGIDTDNLDCICNCSDYSMENYSDPNLENLLIKATEQGLMEVVKFFLKENVDAGEVNTLAAAAKSGNLELINYLYHTVYESIDNVYNLEYYISVCPDYSTAQFFRQQLASLNK